MLTRKDKKYKNRSTKTWSFTRSKLLKNM